MRLIVGLLVMVVGGLLVMGQEEGYGGSSKSNPHGTQAACGHTVKPECKCPKIVSDIQTHAAKKCHEMPASPKEVLECLGKIPSHCEIMRDGHNMPQYDKWLRDKDGKLAMCGTQCYHSKCSCGDQPCKDRMANRGK